MRYNLGKRLREFIPDICKCINLSHTNYKSKGPERILLQSEAIVPLGELKLLSAELLFLLCKLDMFSQGESLNMIYDSTFHILFVWALEKCHNNIYLVKYTEFFKLFCSKANPTSIINALLKTNIVSDLAKFFMDNIFGASMTFQHKDTFQPFILDILSCLKKLENVRINNIEVRLCFVYKRTQEIDELAIPSGSIRVELSNTGAETLISQQ